jgi:dipeptidyl aminopeptidase/acylaminoacyl peptidase
MIRPKALMTLSSAAFLLGFAIALPSCTGMNGDSGSSRSKPSSHQSHSRGHEKASQNKAWKAAPLSDPREKHFGKILQLTFGGENAEAYFNEDGTKFTFQKRRGDTGFECDQIFEFDLKTGKSRLVSTGKGRTTCAYYLKGGHRILYASTHLASPLCPPEPDHSKGYVWPLYPSFDIFSVAVNNPKDLVRLTKNPRYDAEATVCYATGKVLFTSLRNGDLDLYVMNPDGSGVVRITNKLGYDGGGFFSPSGKAIVWRGHHPTTAKGKQDYLSLLGRNLVRPTRMDIFVSDAHGKNIRQLTDNAKANFAPYFYPDEKRIIFASNIDSPRVFHLYSVDIATKKIERITYSSRFNSFPMFSPDGKYVIFSSNRNNAKRGDTNLFLAEWKD